MPNKTILPPKLRNISNSIINTGRRRFIEKAAGLVTGSLLLPRLSPAATVIRNNPAKTLAALKSRVAGTVVERGDPTYEPWRRSMIWQYRKFRRYPDVIVQAETEADVVEAVNFARHNQLKITTRSGGHSWSGCYLRNEGVLVDVSRLQKIEVDTRTGIAVVEAGVIGRGLSEYLRPHGLAFPTAHCGMVPLSGFLLGGGLGLNSGAWGGMSVFNIVGLDVVTAEGELLHVNENRNPDLFWAARGAGPGLFFTVTRFYLRCHPLPRAISTDYYTFHYSDMLQVVEMVEEVGPSLDPNLEVLTVVVPTPPDLAAQCKGDQCGRVVVMTAITFADTLAQAKQMLAPIENHPTSKQALTVLKNRSTPMEVLYQDNEGPFPQRRARADNIYTDNILDSAGVLSKHMLTSPSDGNTPVILWRGDLTFPDAACSTTGLFYLAGYAQWDHAEDDHANQDWLKNFYDEMQPFASGFYINEFDRETRSDMTSACFAPGNWEKLDQLRRQYDPDGVYHDFLSV